VKKKNLLPNRLTGAMDSTIHTQQDNVNSRSGQFGFAINGERTKHRVRLVTNRSDRDSGERLSGRHLDWLGLVPGTRAGKVGESIATLKPELVLARSQIFGAKGSIVFKIRRWLLSW